MKLPKCLIVDDLEQNIVVLNGILQDIEVEIISAKSGKQALELLLTHDFCLSLLDVRMPEMDGFELAEIMRSTEKTKSIPIIFVTAADADSQRIFKGYEAGAVDFLHKPLHPKIVIGKVKVFLELYNQKQLMEINHRIANEELENMVLERTKALIALNEELEAFSYSVSHDLRTPLRSMHGFSQALLKMYDDKLDERGRNYLGRIRESAQKMGELIDGMLILSKLGRKEIKLEQVNLSLMSQQILNNFKLECPSRETEIIITPNLLVQGDLILIQAVLENLLSNAWKYTSTKTITKIQIGVELREKKKVFFIKDNGVGFDMKYSDKLFGAFQRLHGSDQFPGNGIGLATVKRAISRHGGDIWFNGEVDIGAVFYFTLAYKESDI